MRPANDDRQEPALPAGPVTGVGGSGGTDHRAFMVETSEGGLAVSLLLC